MISFQHSKLDANAHELDNGKSIFLQDVTRSEPVKVDTAGRMGLQVPWSSAAIATFQRALLE